MTAKERAQVEKEIKQRLRREAETRATDARNIANQKRTSGAKDAERASGFAEAWEQVAFSLGN